MGFFSRIWNVSRGLLRQSSTRHSPSFSAELDQMLDEELSRTPLPSSSYPGQLSSRSIASRKQKLARLEQRLHSGELDVDEYARNRADLVVGDTPEDPLPIDRPVIKKTL